MLFKLIIAILIILVSGMIGYLKSKKYETREYILRESIILFKGIENEIKYALMPLSNAIEITRQSLKTDLKDVMGNISLKLMQSNVAYYDIYAELEMLNELTSYDRQVIAQGIDLLGKTDIQGEEGKINLTISSLNTILEEAVENKRKNSKMYKTVGLATGLMIAIVLI